jgi:hypothetical protein
VKVEEWNMLEFFWKRGGERGRMMEGINLTKIYCKHICNYYSVSSCKNIVC